MPKGNSSANGDGGEIGNTSQFIDPAASVGSGNDGAIRDSNGNEFDPTIHSSPDSRNADGSFRRKRGRKTGSGGNKSRSQIHSDIKETAIFFTQGLLLFHTSLAAMTKTPELELEEEEAKALADSTLTLAAMYDLTPDPKLQAMMNLAIILGTTYGTRYVAIRARKSQEKEERRKGTAGLYDANGNAVGTTEYRNEGEEWPFKQRDSAPVN